MTLPPRLSSSLLLELLNNAVPDVYGSYASLRRAGGIVRDASGVVMFARYEDIVRTIADPRFAFVGRWSLTASPALQTRMEASGLFELMMFRNGETHRQTRRAMAGLFSAPALERIHVAILAEAGNLLKRWEASGTEDFVSAVIEPLPMRALAVLLGLDEQSLAALILHTRQLRAWLAATVMDHESLVEAVDEFEWALGWLRQQPVVGSRLFEAAPVNAHRSLLADLLVLLVTGYDTSAALLSNATAALVANRAMRVRLAADPAMTTCAVDELIRYDSPGQMAFRHALEDVQLDGWRIARGEFVALLIGSGNRDEAIYERADHMDFERPRFRSLSFGAGPHACLGAALARTQLSAFLQAVQPWLASLGPTGPVASASQYGLLRRHAHLMLRPVAATEGAT